MYEYTDINAYVENRLTDLLYIRKEQESDLCTSMEKGLHWQMRILYMKMNVQEKNYSYKEEKDNSIRSAREKLKSFCLARHLSKSSLLLKQEIFLEKE